MNEFKQKLKIECGNMQDILLEPMTEEDLKKYEEHKTACENAKSVLDIEKAYKEQTEILNYTCRRFEEVLNDTHLAFMLDAVMKKENISIKTLMKREMLGYYDSKIVEEENQC